MDAITYIHDQTSIWNGLRFERDGRAVPLEQALIEGFRISPNDAPLVATLLEQFVRSQAEHTK